jgi:hypothetical protein
MQPLNAIDAVAPAFTRTHQTLFQPFRFGRSWKLAASQYLGVCGAMFLPIPLFVLLVPANAFPGFGTIRVLLLGVSLIYTLIYLVILYFCGRMELVAFEMLVTRAKFVAPMWRRYSARVWPWLGLKIVVGTVFTAMVAAAFYSPIRHMIEGIIAAAPFNHVSIDPKTDPEAFQEALAPFIGQMVALQYTMYALLFVLKAPSTLLNDFVLPFYVLEDISLGAAIGRGWQVMAGDPLQVLLYLVLKPILFIIGYIINQIATLIAMIPVLIVFGIVAAIAGAVGFSVKHADASVLAAAGIVVFALGFVALVFYVTLFTFGYLVALLEAYGIYFLGGRYPLLGDILEPRVDRPFTPPPVFPSREEQKDDDGGPPMPMDPAVA